MPFQIVKGDITKMNCDAIVNAANSSLLGGGGVDGAIHAAAGPCLLEECRTLGGCNPGQSKLTKGYKLPCKYVIHTVGPIWNGGGHGEAETLASCYVESLKLAEEKQCKTVAFPLISAGAYRYPKEQALQIAVQEISKFLLQHEMLVYLVIYNKNSFQIDKKRIEDITKYIDAHYVDTPEAYAVDHTGFSSDSERREGIEQLDESFSQMLIRQIREAGMTDSACYKKANLDQKLFSEVQKNIDYQPSKETAVAFAVALELSLEETRKLLIKADYELSHNRKFDIIIEYFICSGNYNIFEINEALFAFDQRQLGE